ncbi:MAG: phosphatidate cytidylyltransferase [Clostridia bacterium]
MCLAIYPAIFILQEFGILIVFILAALLSIVIFTFQHKYTLKDLIATIFIMFYPILLFAPFFIINGSAIGLLAIMLTLFVPILTDTMAYFVGVTCKGKKLCPNISPKKTISGAIGGLVGGVMGSMLVFVLFDVADVFASFGNVGITHLTSDIGISATIYVVVGLVGAVVCELGDLGASWIKRQAQIKDFGKIFPGHGGIMDRLDSILFVMPLVFIMTKFIVM